MFVMHFINSHIYVIVYIYVYIDRYVYYMYLYMYIYICSDVNCINFYVYKSGTCMYNIISAYINCK